MTRMHASIQVYNMISLDFKNISQIGFCGPLWQARHEAQALRHEVIARERLVFVARRTIQSNQRKYVTLYPCVASSSPGYRRSWGVHIAIKARKYENYSDEI